jgi:uncharacterized OB-fold protein
MPNAPTTVRAAVPFLHFDENGQPYLQGSRCGACDAVAPGTRTICNACGAREGVAPIRLGTSGRISSYTVVYRSFPDVKTPFVSAIVELTGGGVIKGTLIDVAARPEAISFDTPVRLVFRETGQVAADGAPFLSYYFAPAEGPNS